MVKVTLFGIGGTGTSTVRDLLAEKMGFISKNASDMFRGRAKELGIDVSQVSKMSEKDSGDFDKSVDLKTEKFGKENDNFIFEGRLAWYFIPDSIKIKLNCSDEIRMQRMGERDGFSKEEILNKAKLREESDRKRYFEFYGIENYESDKNFDLVIDSSTKTPEEIVEKIIQYINN